MTHSSGLHRAPHPRPRVIGETRGITYRSKLCAQGAGAPVTRQGPPPPHQTLELYDECHRPGNSPDPRRAGEDAKPQRKQDVMTLRKVGSNMTELTLPNAVVLFSYNTPVAAHITIAEGDIHNGFVRT